MIIWLHGPSGAGKSVVGKALADLLGCRFIDTDAEVERAAVLSVAAVFSEHGEAVFRQFEHEAIRRAALVTDDGDTVVALGGGAVVDPRNRDLMRVSGKRIWIDIRYEQAVERLRGAEVRPLLATADAWTRLREERLRLYRDADIRVDGGGDVDSVVKHIARRLSMNEPQTAPINVVLQGRATSIEFPTSIPMLLERFEQLAGGRRFVITDANVVAEYGEVARRLAGAAGEVFTVEPGEGSKSLGVVERIVERMAEVAILRDDTVVAFGGGVVTDLAGFVASVYQRGLRCVSIPTTLLAQVDAAIGGKTAVNVAGVRNLVGTFKQPEAILIHIGFLRTLPERELRSGIVESLKIGLANAPELVRAIEEIGDDARQGRLPSTIGEIVAASVRAKVAVVAEDVFDTGKRLALNYGHTFGHALEAVEPETYAHGEAVAFGIVAAAELAHALGRITENHRAAIVAVVAPLALRGSGGHDPEAIIEAMRGDKKRSADGLRFVLPVESGGVEIVPVDDRETIRAAVERAFERIREWQP